MSMQIETLSSDQTGAPVSVAKHSEQGQELSEIAGNIARTCVILSLTLNKYGITRSVKDWQIGEKGQGSEDKPIAVDAAREAVKVSKKLISSKEYNAIGAYDQRIKKFLSHRATPSHFRSGMYLIPCSLVAETDAVLEEMFAHRQVLVDKFLSKWQELFKNAPQRLRGLYNPLEFQTAEEIGKEFFIEIRYLSYNVPDRDQLQKAIFDREQKKAARYWQEAAEEMRKALRESFAGLVERMTHCLGVGEDGKKRKFTESIRSDMDDFLSYFADRNKTGDDKLAVIVEQARAILNDVSNADIKKDDDTRQRISQAFEAIQNSISQELELVPKRRLTVRKSKKTE